MAREAQENEDLMCIVTDENEEVTSSKKINDQLFGGGSFREPKKYENDKNNLKVIKHLNSLVVKAVSSKKTLPTFY